MNRESHLHESRPMQFRALSPHPLFDPYFYRESNPELTWDQISFGHYLSDGWRKKRSPHPLFSVPYYLSQRPDLASNVEPLTHYISSGWKEGTNPHEYFNTNFYLGQVLSLDGIDPLSHYLTIGWKLGLQPIKTFYPLWYRSTYVDAAASGIESLTHYVTKGHLDGRRPSPGVLHMDRALAPSTMLQDADVPASNTVEARCDLRTFQVEVDFSEEHGSPYLERPLGIFIHLYYDVLAEEIAYRLKSINLPMRIYISTDSKEKANFIQGAFNVYDLGQHTEITVVENCGFDIAPFILSFGDKFNRHDICLKIHGKRSLHNSPEFGQHWREFLYNELFGDPDRVTSVVATMLAHPNLGLLMPRHWPNISDWIGIGDNFGMMHPLLQRIGIGLTSSDDVEYPSGSMFWFRGGALAGLTEAGLTLDEFRENGNSRDQTLAHAVERCFLFFVVKKGYDWGVLPAYSDISELSRHDAIALISESGLFDRAFYLEQNPDLLTTNHDPIEHWYDYGVHEGRAPSSQFDVKHYLREMRRDTNIKMNPLVHYIIRGQHQRLTPTRQPMSKCHTLVDDLYIAYKRADAGLDYVKERKPILRDTDVKILAFYFPQFHPFAENNEFWGKGFTEWTNTTKCLPMFHGHYQPRLPGELGFYDTRLKDVLQRQVELAKQYGVHGFCLHHYFFAGKPVMRAPFDLILANKDLDIPFCVHWANEPWTVRWDGLATKTGILLDQRHDPEDDIKFFEDIRPALLDPRYITINGRPLVVIYRPGLFPNFEETKERWRECCERIGLPPLYLAVMQNSFNGLINPEDIGFDAAIEYPPHNLGRADVSYRVPWYDPGFEGVAWDYQATVDAALHRTAPDYKLFRGIMTEWDCTPRRSNPDLFVNCAPHRYREWLAELVRRTDREREGDEKLIFVNAWNEWAEGAYLEPDRRYGYAYLDATAQARNAGLKSNIDALEERVLVGSHIFYIDLLEEFIDRYGKIDGSFDLLVTTSTENVDAVSKRIQSAALPKLRHFSVLGVENVGRDFFPFLSEFLPRAQEYDLVCWSHSKKSPYETAYAGWRTYMLDNLLGSSFNIATIVEEFHRRPELGILYPVAFPAVADKVEWGSNFELTRNLLSKLGISIDEADRPRFPTAAMFWFRPPALEPLLRLGLDRADFVKHAEGPRDSVSGAIVDGTISHALERMIIYVAEASGYVAEDFVFYPG